MWDRQPRGFTIIELMFVIGIIGILAVIAIPNFIRFQLRAKSAEARVHLVAIAYLQRVHIKTQGRPRTCEAMPKTVPGKQTVAFVASKCWQKLGFQPDYEVYYQYETEARGNKDFVIYARGDLDGDTESHPDHSQSLFEFSSQDDRILWRTPGVF